MQPEILLTLSAGSLRPLLAAQDPRCREVFSLPRFVARDLGLRGLNLPSDLLSGFGMPDVERLRDEADRAHCPVLLLIEETPIDFTDRGALWHRALDRLKRVGLAASRLGCPSVAIRVAAPDTDEAFEATAVGVKAMLRELDRYELNVLLAPSSGLTETAGRLTDLIKKIGGFRIGSYPSFEHAYATGELEKTLRKLAPYAPAIAASVRGFSKSGVHEPYALEACVACVMEVGYGNTLAIDHLGPPPPAGGRKPKATGSAASSSVVSAVVSGAAIAALVADIEQARRILDAATKVVEPEDEVEEELVDGEE